MLGEGSLDQFKHREPMTLPGGLALRFGTPEAGVTSSVGLNETFRAKAYELKKATEQDLTDNRDARRAANDALSRSIADRKKALEAATIKFDLTQVPTENVTGSKLGVYGPEGKTYLLWMPAIAPVRLSGLPAWPRGSHSIASPWRSGAYWSFVQCRIPNKSIRFDDRSDTA